MLKSGLEVEGARGLLKEISNWIICFKSQKIFSFQMGTIPSKGPISKFKIALGGPDMSEIENKLRFRINEHEERVEDFTVDGYLRKYGLKVAKLNLLTMVDSPQEKLNKERENLNNTPLVIEDSEDDSELHSINYSTPMSQVSMFVY